MELNQDVVTLVMLVLVFVLAADGVMTILHKPTLFTGKKEVSQTDAKNDLYDGLSLIGCAFVVLCFWLYNTFGKQKIYMGMMWLALGLTVVFCILRIRQEKNN